MNRIEQMKEVFSTSKLSTLLIEKAVEYDEAKDCTKIRFQSNNFRIRSIEIWDKNDIGKGWCRVYHSPQVPIELKQLIDTIQGGTLKISAQRYSDFYDDAKDVINALAALLDREDVIKIVESNPRLTRNSAYEGLILPDVDVTETNVFGRTFTWKELIAISEDDSEENVLLKILSQSGVYLQRSRDGRSRYVGSAYGEEGILGRWLRHLSANGNAKHLNIYVLENGYAEMLFAVLEITDQALAAESRWKETLGTRNSGPYDGFRLNSN